jgi:glycosyltransferase involved in cell wall biosynthesis
MRLNIIIIAHEVCPYSGSECSIGWNTIINIAEHHNLTVLHASTNQKYSVNYEQNINKFLLESSKALNIQFISIPQPKINIFFSKINKISKNYAIGFPIIYQFIYRLWLKKSLKKATILSKKNTYHIAHHITSIHIVNPSNAYKLKIPFVWGPTGGLIKLKNSFLKDLDLKVRVREVLRNLFIDFMRYFSLNFKRSVKNASLIYLFSKEDLEVVQHLTKARLKLQIDTGTEIPYKAEKILSKHNDEINAIWVGSISSRKCPEILLKALDKVNFNGKKFTLTIVYAGEFDDALNELLIPLKNRINIFLKNNIAKDEVQQLMKKSDFFIHTSYREAASAVILEAISNGLPVICHDVSGMALAVSDDSGIKIPLVSYDLSIKLFAEATTKLINNKDILDTKTLASFRRAEELSWKKKAQIIANDYTEVYKNSQ